jgi:TolB-like protein
VIPSLAVLPFQNLSGDAEPQYFSDGFTEDINTELSRSRSLSLFSAT